MELMDLISRSWSEAPLQARFENETKWFDYQRITRLLDQLEASDNQMMKLVEKGVLSHDQHRPKMRDAVVKLSELAETERERKAKLPATKYMRKKMDEYGITYSEDVAREEAKALVAEHERRASILENIDTLKQIGVEVPAQVVSAASVSNETESGIGDALEDLLSILEDIRETGVKVDVSPFESLQELLEMNERYRGAILDVENTEDELKERELLVGYDEYRLVGPLPKEGMIALKQEVFNRSLAGSWNLEKQVLDLVSTHLPQVLIKKIDG